MEKSAFRIAPERAILAKNIRPPVEHMTHK
jgi:hypothetical protein